MRKSFVLVTLGLTLLLLTGCTQNQQNKPYPQTEQFLDKDSEIHEEEKGKTESEIIDYSDTIKMPHTSEVYMDESVVMYEMNSKDREEVIAEIYARHPEGTMYEMLNPIEQYNVTLCEVINTKYEDESKYYKANFDTYVSGTVVSVDLDGDGIEEKINYAYEFTEKPYVLEINHTPYEKYVSGPNWKENFAIVDLDTTDDYLEIAISDYGASSDYKTNFLRYKQGELLEVGEVEGLFDYGIGIDGKGNVLSRTRAMVLQTWYYQKPYHLEGDTLQPTSVGAYSVFDKLMVKKPWDLYKTTEPTEVQFVAQTADVLTIVATDDKSWCKVISQDGEEGFLLLKDAFDLLGKDGEAVHPAEVLAGLCYAD